MVYKNGFFAKTIDEAKAEIGNSKTLCLSNDTDKAVYIINEKAELYCATLIMRMEAYWVTRRNPEKPRKDGTIVTRLSFGGRETVYKLAELIFCTFFAGYWIPDSSRLFTFADGNKNHVELCNIKPEKPKEDTRLHDNMVRFAKIYEEWYRHVVKVCSYNFCFKMTHHQIEDFVSDSFIYECGRKYKYDEDTFIRYWITHAKRKCIDFVRQKSAFYLCDEEWMFPVSYQRDYEFLLYEILERPSERQVIELTWKGYSKTDIAEKLGISYGTVSSHLCRGIKSIKEYINGTKK